MTHKTPTFQNVAWFTLKSIPGQACTWQFLCFAEDYFREQSGREQLKNEAICICTDVYSWASTSLPDLRKTVMKQSTSCWASEALWNDNRGMFCDVVCLETYLFLLKIQNTKMTSVVVCTEKPRLRWQTVLFHKWLQMFGWRLQNTRLFKHVHVGKETRDVYKHEHICYILQPVSWSHFKLATFKDVQK